MKKFYLPFIFLIVQHGCIMQNSIGQMFSDTSTNSSKIGAIDKAILDTNLRIYNLAAYYKPGKYLIPKTKSDLAATLFNPLLDSIINLANIYSNKQRTASLVILGYTDEGECIDAAINNLLLKKMGKKSATKTALAKQLSQMRADEVINLLSLKFLQRSNEIKNFEQFKIEYISKGNGSNLPIPNIRNYKINDERRRIVLCYWVVAID